MNVTDAATKALVLRCLIDGMGVRATARLSGLAKGTVLRILAEAGDFCGVYQDIVLRNLPTKRVEADEIWSFCGSKTRNAPALKGDLWTFCAIDADTKLVCCWLVGARTPENCNFFVADLAARVTNRIQLSTDAWGPYLRAVRRAFGFGRVDFATILKELGSTAVEGEGPARRYSPPVVIGVQKSRHIGAPDMELVSTSYVERLNLAIRQHCKRFARLTSAHSRKAENHVAAVNLNFFAHNFIRVHSSLSKQHARKMTPAMASGLTDRVWTIDDLVTLMDPKSVTVK